MVCIIPGKFINLNTETAKFSNKKFNFVDLEAEVFSSKFFHLQYPYLACYSAFPLQFFMMAFIL